MKQQFDDQRLKEFSYLRGVEFMRADYRIRASHSREDRCVICKAAFGPIEAGGALENGYTTTRAFAGGGLYEWICAPCFEQSKDALGLIEVAPKRRKSPGKSPR